VDVAVSVADSPLCPPPPEQPASSTQRATIPVRTRTSVEDDDRVVPTGAGGHRPAGAVHRVAAVGHGATDPEAARAAAGGDVGIADRRREGAAGQRGGRAGL